MNILRTKSGLRWNCLAPIVRAALLGTAALTIPAASALAAQESAPVTFSGPAQQFSIGLGASANVTVEGHGNYHVTEVFGGLHETITIPHQTRSLDLNPTTLTSNPVGGATIGFDQGTLANPTLADLNVDFRNGAAWNFAFNPIVFDLDVEDVGNVGLRLNLFGSIGQISFAADPGAVPASPGYGIPGQFTTAISGTVTAVAQDVIGGVDFDLGQIASLDSMNVSSFVLPGSMALSTNGPPYPSILFADLDLNLPISVPLSISQSGHIEQVEGHGSGNVDLFLDYSIDGNLILSNLNYSLHGFANDAVVPEPGSFALAGLGGVGLLVWCRKRGKRAKAARGH